MREKILSAKRLISTQKASLFIALIISALVALMWLRLTNGQSNSPLTFTPEQKIALESLLTHELKKQNTIQANHALDTEYDALNNDPNFIDLETAFTTASWKSVKVKRGDSITHIFKREKLPLKQLNQILTLPDANKILSNLDINKTVEFQTTDSGTLLQLRYPLSDDQTFLVSAAANNTFTAQIQQIQLERRVVQAASTINGSVSDTLKTSGIPSKVFSQLGSILSPEFNFSRDLRKGDFINVIYQEVYRGDNKIKTGHIIAAELKTARGKSYHAIRYVNADGTAGYYNANGESYEQGFLRSPVKYTRISSSFSPSRVHPITGRARPHRGVDLAAPTGTRIVASGNGKITQRGWNGGYGNSVTIDHGNGITTLYAHMSRFSKNQKAGQTVKKGDVIGYVGMTGVATGPHLHYEYRVNGAHKDPMKVKLPSGPVLASTEKVPFLVEANRWLYRLAQISGTEIEHPIVLAMYDAQEG